MLDPIIIVVMFALSILLLLGGIVWQIRRSRSPRCRRCGGVLEVWQVERELCPLCKHYEDLHIS